MRKDCKLLMPVLLAVLFGMSGIAAYAGQFGSPEPASREKIFSLGLGYFNYGDRWAPGDSNQEDVKIKAQQEYLQMGFRLMEKSELYLRMGYSGLEIKDAFAAGPGLSGFKSDFRGKGEILTAGFKNVFDINSWLGAGPFIQANISIFGDSTKGMIADSGGNQAAIQEMSVLTKDVNIGMAAQSKIFGMTFYAGPVVFWSRTIIKHRMAAGEKTLFASSTDYHAEKNNFGGFAGLKFPLGGNLVLEIEGQKKNQFSAGALIMYLF